MDSESVNEEHQGVPFSVAAYAILNKFIRKTAANSRARIPHAEFEEFVSLVYDRREELKDAEYMNIMQELSGMLGHVINCHCGPEPHNICVDDVASFVSCRNFDRFAEYMPAIKFLKFEWEHPNYSHAQLQRFIATECPTPLSINVGASGFPVDIKDMYLSILVKLLNLKDSLALKNNIHPGSITNVLVVILLLKFSLEYKPADRHKSSYYKTMYEKCKEFIADCVNPVCGQVMQLTGWHKSPFLIIKGLIDDNHMLLGLELQ
jgi:hypothetical protein